MNSVDKCLIALIISVLAFFAAIALCAQTAAPVDTGKTLPDSLALSDSLKIKEDTLSYAADSVAYDYDNEQIYLFGNTNVQYQTSTITADSLQVDVKGQRAFSSGKTVMQDKDQVLIGNNVYYDVTSRTGIMQRGVSRFDKGFYYGEEIRRITDNVYDVDSGRFTTCDDPNPDFWFWTKELRLYRNDKVVGKPVLFYVNHVPILYFPYLTFSIKRGRQQGFLMPEPGYNNVDGKFVRNIAYFYPYKDYADATLALDLLERTGWQLDLETRYNKKDIFNGEFEAAYKRRYSIGSSSSDYSIVGNHHHDLPEKASIDVNLNYASSRRMYETSNDAADALQQNVTSSASYRKPLLSSYLNVGATYTQDLIHNTATVSLPSASYSFPTRPVYELFSRQDSSIPDAWWANFNFSYNVYLSHYGTLNSPHRTFADLFWSDKTDSTGLIHLNEHHAGIKNYFNLNYTYKLFGWLNLTEGANYEEVWMDRDREGHKPVRGNDYSATSSANFTLYGLRTFPNFYISAVRHIVTPTVSLSFNPNFRSNDRFYYFDNIGLLSAPRSTLVNLSLAQKWQLKLAAKGEVKERKLDNFMQLTSSTGFNLEHSSRPDTTITHTLTVNPATWESKWAKVTYDTRYTVTHNPYRMHFTDWQFRSQNITHSVTISGPAQYTDYFPRPRNAVFDSYLPGSDSLAAANAPLDISSNEDNWSVTLAQEFVAGKDMLHPRNNNLRLDAKLKVSTNWSLQYANYYNITQSEMLSQSFDITRILHCWRLRLSYTRRNDYWDYRVVFENIALPNDLKFQTHDRNRF